jgi:hypothetical protein
MLSSLLLFDDADGGGCVVVVVVHGLEYYRQHISISIIIQFRDPNPCVRNRYHSYALIKDEGKQVETDCRNRTTKEMFLLK